jgi:hypothetical protein
VSDVAEVTGDLHEFVAKKLYDEDGAQVWESDGAEWDSYCNLAERHLDAVPDGWGKINGVWVQLPTTPEACTHPGPSRIVNRQPLWPARILDARERFGRTDYLITPIGGSGQTWVSSERVSIRKEASDGEAR